MKPDLPQLDILIYAHDGRGLGHVSRSVAIGMAVRRLYPELKVCLITGCRQTQELIGEAPLEWLKLPAYRTEVVGGKSRGIDGFSGYSDSQLGLLRGEQISQVFELYRPRLVLVDHSPQGKHKELIPALKRSKKLGDTQWLLGMRGVVGNVKQTASLLARDLYRDFYSGLFWYGDSTILGIDHKRTLEKQFATEICECGYVSRMSELSCVSNTTVGNRYNCTISVPWTGEDTDMFLENLATVVRNMDPPSRKIALFLGEGVSQTIFKTFECIDGCRVEPFGSSYARVLNSSRTAVIFGGYNSLVDVLTVDIPSLIVTRDMQDKEQQQHLDALCVAVDALTVIEEKECDEVVLAEKMGNLLAQTGASSVLPMNCNGAENAAAVLASLLVQGKG